MTLAIQFFENARNEDTLVKDNTSTYVRILIMNPQSRVEATTCYDLPRVKSHRLAREMPRVKLEKCRSCHTHELKLRHVTS